jgi:hypothetical protein
MARTGHIRIDGQDWLPLVGEESSHHTRKGGFPDASFSGNRNFHSALLTRI